MFAYCGNDPFNRVDFTGECFYSANGVWMHDNWEYIGDYERKPDPRIANEKSEAQVKNYINTFAESYGLSKIDDYICSYLKPLKSTSILTGSSVIIDNIADAAEKFGILSIVDICLKVTWDCGTYGDDMENLMISITIDGLSALGSLGVTALVATCGFTGGASIFASAFLGSFVSSLESWARRKYLGEE